MSREARAAVLITLLGLLVVVLYPALALNRRMAPEASLKSTAPWRAQWGPNPAPSPLAVEAATRLGPRLAMLNRDGFKAALWDPWVGGGRPGWLASPREGGAPLAVVAALAARPGWVWSALVALEVGLAFVTSWWVLRGLGLGVWAAPIGAVAYCLSGAATSHWLDWQGSALALGPLALLPALGPWRPWQRRVAAWAAAGTVLMLSGAPALPFAALALSWELLGGQKGLAVSRWGALLLGLGLAIAVCLPGLWLAATGGEPGAPPEAVSPGPPITSWRVLLAPSALPDLAGVGAPDQAPPAASPDNAGFLGAAAVLLGLLGLVSMTPLRRGFWTAVATVSLLLAVAPEGALMRLGIHDRPFGVLALAVAIMAAHGAETLCMRVGARWRGLVGPALLLVLVWRLAPVALPRLPYATDREAELPSPLPPNISRHGSRALALLAAMPPDVAASLGFCDVRASFFDREPQYATLVGSRGLELSVSQGLDPAMGRLGVRWILEPLPLRVVSSELFARIELGEALRLGTEAARTARYRLAVPGGACRLGLPREAEGTPAVFLQCNGDTHALADDLSLAEESAAWQWLALPPGMTATECVLGISGGDAPQASSLTVAWDRSGLRLVEEGGGVRLWESDTAQPFVFLATGVARESPEPPLEPTVVALPENDLATARPLVGHRSPGHARLLALAPGRLAVEVEAPAPSLLVAQVKYRPRLWRAEVNGRRQPTQRADRVWTAVPVPAGRSRVTLQAGLPAWLWLLSAAAAIMTGLFSIRGRAA